MPIVESGYQPYAYSPSSAAGIWQFIPATAKVYGLSRNWGYDGRRDIIESTDAAIHFLSDMHRHFHGDWFLARDITGRQGWVHSDSILKPGS